jgi:pimeloyl-ACP methyl ester carboxylesterase
LLGLVVTYGLFLAFVALGVTDRVILFPTTAPLDTRGLARHDVPLPGGASSIEIWSTPSRGAAESPAGPKAYVLAFIGNAARAELTAPFYAKDWGDRPVEIWAVNYPGYGRTPGPARLASIGPCALAAYDALRERAGDRPIFLEARSIGTAAALYVAARRPDVDGCILHNPPPLRQLIRRRHGWWNLWLLAGPVSMTVPDELDSLANARRVTAPAIFLLTGADGVVPPAYQQLVADAYAGEKRVIQLSGAGHVDRASGKALEEYEAAMDWMAAQVSEAGPGRAAVGSRHGRENG